MTQRLSAVEQQILRTLLTDPHKPCYGFHLLKDGVIKRGTIYTTLHRMERKGLLQSHWEQPGPDKGVPRRLYEATSSAVAALAAMASAELKQCIGVVHEVGRE